MEGQLQTIIYNKVLNNIALNTERLNRAEGYLKLYELNQEFLTSFNRESTQDPKYQFAKRNYEFALEASSSYHSLMLKEDITSRADLEEQRHELFQERQTMQTFALSKVPRPLGK
ncbi:hypothetical protein [Bacillus sp. MMSF_3328]|uniref:hypothetical protein n=1 Tax=Bacillus sp. MMSF_3328 TaxID=3047080 RepID=UPI00273F4FF6|nr:hypothetical protein [Bacillus sp. MMSF_3328]